LTDIDDEIRDRLIDHILNRTTDLGTADLLVPVSNFTSPERAAAELGVLRRMPVVAGHRSEVPEPGSYITREVLGTPLIIVRQSDGTVASYINMCRHRGGRVATETQGKKRNFVCAYHGWVYSRDGGELVKVPFEHFFGDVDKSCNGLRSVRTEELHGLIWVNFAGPDATSVSEYLGPEVERQLKLGELEGATIFMDHWIPLDMNWKLVLDGAIDILHPQFLHPTGVGKLIETQTTVWMNYGRHGQGFSPRKKMTTLVREGQPIDSASRYVGSNLYIYPNCQVIAAPDHIEFWTVWPDLKDPAKCLVNIRFLIDPEKLDERMAGRLNRSWEILKQAAEDEDWPMAASIQQNALAHSEGFFRYGRNEQSCAHLHRQLSEDLGEI
jgi:nitrite reductase/ring-hydroxylating ferredoxin subunit